MRLAFWFRVQRQIHDLGDLLIADRWFTTTPFGYLTESDQSVLLELATPGQHSRTRDSDHLTDLGIRDPVSGQQQ